MFSKMDTWIGRKALPLKLRFVIQLVNLVLIVLPPDFEVAYWLFESGDSGSTEDNCELIHEYSQISKNEFGVIFLAQGWLQDVRTRKTHVFLELNDGSSYRTLQVVVPREIYNVLPQTPNFGSSVRVVGTLQKSPKPLQPVELIAETVQVIGACDEAEFPFKIKTVPSADSMRTNPQLRARTRFGSSVLRVRHALNMAVHEFFDDNGFTFVHTPILTTNDCEGGGETFLVTPSAKAAPQAVANSNAVTALESKYYFGNDQAFLSVSGQLHLEAVACGLKKVYNFAPAFRAELQQSTRHLSEFYMVEAEMAFMQSLDELLDFIEYFLRTITSTILTNSRNDCEDVWQHSAKMSDEEQREETKDERRARLRRKDVVKTGNIIPSAVQNLLSSTSPFSRISYDDAYKAIKNVHEKTFNTPLVWGENLRRDHELFVCNDLAGGSPVFVTHFPQRAKPFYMHTSDRVSEVKSDELLTDSADLIFPAIGELVGGSLRESRLERLSAKIDQHGLGKRLDWYLDLRRFGGTQMGGFGMGVERYLQWLLAVPNIRDVVPFARWYKHCQL